MMAGALGSRDGLSWTGVESACPVVTGMQQPEDRAGGQLGVVSRQVSGVNKSSTGVR